MRPRLDPYPGALARFRVTAAQAVGTGAGRGLVVSGVAGVAVVAASLVAVTDDGLDWSWLAVLVLPVPLGAAVSLVTRGRVGVDADNLGLHRVSVVPVRRSSPFLAWPRIVDIRAERHGGRTVVAVYLERGVAVWLPAPYHGRFFARDPRFEWKLFTLRNLWATHRSSGSS